MVSKLKSITNERNNIIILLIIIINLLAFFNFDFFTIYNNYFLILNFITLIIFFIMQYRLNRKDLELILFLLFFVIYGLFTLCITAGGLGSILTPVYSIIAYWAIKKSKFNYRYIHIITIVMIILNVYWVINSPGSFEKYLYNKEGYYNSNTIGSVLLYTSIYSTIFIKRLNWKWSKLLSTLIYLTSFWGISNTQARGSLITLFIFLVLDIAPKKIWRKKSFSLLVSVGIILIGVMFTYVYSLMFLKGVNFVIPFINKPLFTGREIIWLNFYNSITQKYTSLFFGLGSAADLWTGHTLNLHNSYLTVITNFGIIGFIMYYAFWIRQIRNLYKLERLSEYQIRLFLGFLCVLFYGYIEVSILWHVMFSFNFMFLGLACNEISEYKEKEIDGKIKNVFGTIKTKRSGT